MSGLDWPGLMRLGLGRLGLTPDRFWALTPAELRLMAGIEARPACTRSAFDALSRAFPDGGANEERRHG